MTILLAKVNNPASILLRHVETVLLEAWKNRDRHLIYLSKFVPVPAFPAPVPAFPTLLIEIMPGFIF